MRIRPLQPTSGGGAAWGQGVGRTRSREVDVERIAVRYCAY
jgi:hypothetical protein